MISKFLSTALLVLVTILNVQAQVFDGINYQAVAIDSKGREIAGVDINGRILHSKVFNVRFSIYTDSPNGELVYQEFHPDVVSDANGLFSLIIGHGEVTSSSANTSLLNLNWGSQKKFLKVEFDLKKNNDFKVVAIEQLMAVPYAFYALNAQYANQSGNGIKQIIDNNDGTLTFVFVNDETYTTNKLTGLSAAGEKGINALIESAEEAAGNNCLYGGVKIQVGLDNNKNGELDVNEIDNNQTRFLCNGAQDLKEIKAKLGKQVRRVFRVYKV